MSNRSHDGGPYPLAHHYRESNAERQRRQERFRRAADLWKLSTEVTVIPPEENDDHDRN